MKLPLCISWNPQAVPLGLGIRLDLVGIMACLSLSGQTISDSSLADIRRTCALASSLITSLRPVARAAAREVISSAVGPSPPVTITMSLLRPSSFKASMISGSLSPTVRCRWTRKPSVSSTDAIVPALVSVIWPQISSSPMLKVDIFMIRLLPRIAPIELHPCKPGPAPRRSGDNPRIPGQPAASFRHNRIPA